MSTGAPSSSSGSSQLHQKNPRASSSKVIIIDDDSDSDEIEVTTVQPPRKTSKLPCWAVEWSDGEYKVLKDSTAGRPLEEWESRDWDDIAQRVSAAAGGVLRTGKDCEMKAWMMHNPDKPVEALPPLSSTLQPIRSRAIGFQSAPRPHKRRTVYDPWTKEETLQLLELVVAFKRRHAVHKVRTAGWDEIGAAFDPPRVGETCRRRHKYVTGQSQGLSDTLLRKQNRQFDGADHRPTSHSSPSAAQAPRPPHARAGISPESLHPVASTSIITPTPTPYVDSTAASTTTSQLIRETNLASKSSRVSASISPTGAPESARAGQKKQAALASSSSPTSTSHRPHSQSTAVGHSPVVQHPKPTRAVTMDEAMAALWSLAREV